MEINKYGKVLEYILPYPEFNLNMFKNYKKFYYLKLLIKIINEIENRDYYPIKIYKATKRGTRVKYISCKKSDIETVNKVKKFMDDYIDKCKEVDPTFKCKIEYN